ncbi:Dyp-type peroxidase [Lacimicrobium alkaliphilum]|uniref:Peroxidase n=1 Tax=Lacimicrobium alkaliphilum TaxID=1526571 RepID=A0A0U3AHC0_9ALTE|nr:Dyp-type peroxidase [Lacimicrobium alkaliphilum]ALS97458.1 peroxidase [Lacimicrobium alkaliphilum]
MSQPQKGVCAEPSLHALYLLFNVIDEDAARIRKKLAQLLNIFEYYDEEHYEAMVSGMVAIGSNYWLELYPGLIPVELAPFPDLHSEDRRAPAEPCDLFIQIRADRADICHLMGMEVCELLREQTELVEQVKGFRYLEGRDLTGFVTDADNPKGMKKLDVAIVGDDDADFSGGSYVHVQRYRHDLLRWQQLDLARQEMIMGRTKDDNKRLSDTLMAAFSHAAHTGNAAKASNMLFHSMPYGDMQTQGLMVVCCCSSARPFVARLESMIFGDQDGNYDRWLDYTSAETGAAFFAPSIQFLKRHASDL